MNIQQNWWLQATCRHRLHSRKLLNWHVLFKQFITVILETKQIVLCHTTDEPWQRRVSLAMAKILLSLLPGLRHVYVQVLCMNDLSFRQRLARNKRHLKLLFHVLRYIFYFISLFRNKRVIREGKKNYSLLFNSNQSRDRHGAVSVWRWNFSSRIRNGGVCSSDPPLLERLHFILHACWCDFNFIILKGSWHTGLITHRFCTSHSYIGRIQWQASANNLVIYWHGRNTHAKAIEHTARLKSCTPSQRTMPQTRTDTERQPIHAAVYTIIISRIRPLKHP